MMRLRAAVAALAMLAACSKPEPASPAAEAPLAEAAVAEAAPGASETVTRIAPLPELFDCLRERGSGLVASHRGGPAPGFPENALETLEHGLSQGIRVFEVDVASSRDGVLFLHHDDRFGRTADGDSYVADTDWADIARLRLKDPEGEVTGLHPPKLTDVLLWAKQHGAVLELDRVDTIDDTLMTAIADVGTRIRDDGGFVRVCGLSPPNEPGAQAAKSCSSSRGMKRV